MLTQYIELQLKKARYKILKDGQYFGSISTAKGVWASAKTRAQCKKELQEVLEEWIALKLSARAVIPGLYIRSTLKRSETDQRLYA